MRKRSDLSRSQERRRQGGRLAACGEHWALGAARAVLPWLGGEREGSLSPR